MALYKNQAAASPIASVEFAPMPDGNFSFFTLRNKQDAEGVKQWLTSQGVGQKLIAETAVNGQPVLVTQGSQSQQALLTQLSAQHGEFSLVFKPKKNNIWAIRGNMGMVGQGLQIVSSFLNASGLDVATLSFASLNLLANGTNIIFGAEQLPDTHRLRFLKKEINRKVAPYSTAEQQLPGVDDDRQALRAEPQPPQTLGEKAYAFMKHNSVSIGEIGLRYLGSVAIAFPLSTRVMKTITRMQPTGEVNEKGEKLYAQVSEEVARNHFTWGGINKIGEKNYLKGIPEGAYGLRGGASVLKHGEWGSLGKAGSTLKQAFLTARNKDVYSLTGGLLYLTGKSIALTSKVHDPYDPDHHSPIDWLRENVTFRLSSLIEMTAGGTIAFDRFRNRKIILPDWKILPKTIFGKEFRGHKTADFIGGIGGALFAGAYFIRLFAPFGEMNLNMDEVKAHATDALATVPPEKIPQLMADCTATIKEHTKDQHMEFGEIYSQMAGCLYRYHHEAMQNVPTLTGSHQNQPFEYPRQSKQHGGPVSTLAPDIRHYDSVIGPGQQLDSQRA